MARPSQPPGNRNLKNPNKVKAPVPVEPVNTPQEQRQGLAEVVIETQAPEALLSQETFDSASILRVGSVSAQAAVLQRLNAAQGHEAAAHIGSTQGNRHLSTVLSSLHHTPSQYSGYRVAVGRGGTKRVDEDWSNWELGVGPISSLDS